MFKRSLLLASAVSAMIAALLQSQPRGAPPPMPHKPIKKGSRTKWWRYGTPFDRDTYRRMLRMFQREYAIGVDPIFANSYRICGRAAREDASRAWKQVARDYDQRYNMKAT